jgi:hypothetical protein
VIRRGGKEEEEEEEEKCFLRITSFGTASKLLGCMWGGGHDGEYQ